MTQENPSSGFPNRSDTNGPEQSEMKVRILKFWVEVKEELYYLSSENKGADQLCSYCTADLRLCFCIGKKFSHDDSEIYMHHHSSIYGYVGGTGNTLNALHS